MEQECMYGLITECTMVIGKTTRCMAWELSLGLMEGNTRVTTSMIRNKEGVFSHGLMAGDMMESGSMGNNMVKVYIIPQREKSKEESGKMEKESDGSLTVIE